MMRLLGNEPYFPNDIVVLGITWRTLVVSDGSLRATQPLGWTTEYILSCF